LLTRNRTWSLCFLALLLLPVAVLGLQISQLEYELVLGPGDSESVTLSISNNSERDQSITLYLGDWDRDSRGANRFFEPGTLERSLSNWLSLDTASVVLGAGETCEIPVTIHVPPREEATLSGTYWAIVFLQGEARVEERGRTGITSIQQFGVKIYATIKGTERNIGSVGSMVVAGTEDELLLSAAYANAGNVKQEVTGEATILDDQGQVLALEAIPWFPILPGSNRVVHVALDPLESGAYLARVILDFGGEGLAREVVTFRVD